jgi:hypothetical protein
MPGIVAAIVGVTMPGSIGMDVIMLVLGGMIMLVLMVVVAVPSAVGVHMIVIVGMAAHGGFLSGLIRALRPLTQSTLNQEPKWRHNRAELATGYQPRH